VGDVTVYALFDDKGKVESAYSHRMQLNDIVKTTDEPEMSEWTCKHCNEQAQQGTANMTYMGITRSGPAIVCPKCGDSWVEEYLATKTIAAAEGLFEKKKA
jgi:transcription elongation factor Elf1